MKQLLLIFVAMNIGLGAIQARASAQPTRATAVKSAPGGASGGDLTFVVSHVRDSVGHVRVDICTLTTFLKAECPFSGAAIAVQGTTTVTIANLPQGTYAAQLYHDRNDNHTVDRGAFGIPLEEIGFSQDAPVGLRGPRFAKAAFIHGSGDQTLTVRLRRFK